MNKTVNNELDRIFASGASEIPVPDSIDLVGAVRPSPNPNFIQLALDNTGRWVDLPRELIASAQHVAKAKHDDSSYAVVRFALRHPDGDSSWFDLLQFVLQRASLLHAMAFAKSGNGCGCDQSVPATSVPVPAMRSAGTLSCIACWILTAGQGPDFCYAADMCG